MISKKFKILHEKSFFKAVALGAWEDEKYTIYCDENANKEPNIYRWKIFTNEHQMLKALSSCATYSEIENFLNLQDVNI